MGGKKIDYTGQTFGLLTAIKFSHHEGEKRVWEFECACGKHCWKTMAWVVRDVKRGRTPSCGCLTKELWHREHPKQRKNKAALQRNHPLYSTWASMRTRCTNPHCRAWPYYGGRGIQICDRWMKNFWDFVEDMYPSWQPGLTLDRKDNSGNYCPENCRWVTMKTQGRNRRSNVVTEGKTIAQLSEETGLSYSTLITRYNTGKRGKDLVEPLRFIKL